MLLALILMGIAAVPGGADLPATYRFFAGDVIEVTVTPQKDFGRTVTVQPDGKISYPVVGQLQAAGLTVEEFVTALRDGLGRELVDPEVTVSLKEINKQATPRVSLLGAVRSPGVFEIAEGSTLAEVLAKAGGPTLLADLRHVVVTRPDRTVTTVDLEAVGKAGNLERNVALRPGDFIVIPEGAAPTVLVLGEVGKPGSIPIQGEMRLLDALAQAGGPTTKADLRRVTLARTGASGARTLDLQPLLAGKETANPEVNPFLRTGDTIVIGETSEQVYVLGRVARPDIYPIKPNDRVLDAFTRAGGAASDGDITRAVLVRRDKNGQPAPKKLDLKKLMETGKVADNELIRPGDVLFIPDKKQRRGVDPLNLLYPLTGLLGLFR
jgi:polysaccharide export outer membrane protein